MSHGKRFMGVLKPSPATLKRYGLSEMQWKRMIIQQCGKCYVCQDIPESGRLCIDHDHIHRWRHSPPTERVKAVRGLLCFYCNFRRVGRGMTLAYARRIVSYLEAYEERKAEINDSPQLG
jgi:hypothetical protein